jgi:hypothetical protein
MADLNTFRCPECKGKIDESDFTITPFDNSEVEISVECCDKLYSTFIEATEFHVQE